MATAAVDLIVGRGFVFDADAIVINSQRIEVFGVGGAESPMRGSSPRA